jgi:chorismate dehydratase
LRHKRTNFKINPLDNKIRVGIVNYLNTKPLLYGLQHSPLINDIVLVQDYPAEIAKHLQADTIDIGLVPVAVIPGLSNATITGTHCIGCDGPVASVCLFSEVPMAQVRTVLLDYQSRTSVELAKMLLREHWKIEPELIYTKSDYQSDIKGTTAGLVIGDRALAQRGVSPFIYDLGETWKIHTGKPFVFAAWISNKELDPGFLKAFDEANALGVDNIANVLMEVSHPSFDLEAYYTQYIRYKLDEDKRQGLQLFLRKLAGQGA